MRVKAAAIASGISPTERHTLALTASGIRQGQQTILIGFIEGIPTIVQMNYEEGRLQVAEILRQLGDLILNQRIGKDPAEIGADRCR